MPMVHIKEKKRVLIAKAPLRGLGTVFDTAAMAVKGVGEGLAWIGGKVSMGKSGGKWIPEADVMEHGKLVEDPAPKRDFKVFNDAGQRAWTDDESTTAGSVLDEKDGTGF